MELGMSDYDSKFSAIMEKAINEAEAVDCSLEEFLEGLEVMQGVLETRMESVADELDSETEDEDEDSDDDGEEPSE